MDPVRILLATDAASEGSTCRPSHRLPHWEIRGTPTGWSSATAGSTGMASTPPRWMFSISSGAGKARARQGSPGADEQSMRSLLGERTDGSALEDELYFLYVAAKKVDQIREDLGSAGEVIAAQIEQKMLGKRADWQSADVEIARRASNAELKINRELARDLEKLTGTLAESRGELNLSPATVERVVRTALRLAHHKDLTEATPPPGFYGQCFRLPELSGAWGDARNDGLYNPVTSEERPTTFDHDAAADRTDVVLLHLGHRLVQMCLRLLRAELWSGTTAVGQQRRSAGSRPGRSRRRAPHPAVAGHIRVVVTGPKAPPARGSRRRWRHHRGRRLVRTTEEDLKSWLTAAGGTAPAQVRDRLTELWPGLSQPLAGILANRAGARRRSLATLIESRCTEEVAAMNTILDELEHSIRAALDDTPFWEQSQPVRDRGGTRPAPQGPRRIEAAAGVHSGDARAGDSGAAPPLRRPASPLVPRRHHLPGARLHRARWGAMAPSGAHPPGHPALGVPGGRVEARATGTRQPNRCPSRNVMPNGPARSGRTAFIAIPVLTEAFPQGWTRCPPTFSTSSGSRGPRCAKPRTCSPPRGMTWSSGTCSATPQVLAEGAPSPLTCGPGRQEAASPRRDRLRPRRPGWPGRAAADLPDARRDAADYSIQGPAVGRRAGRRIVPASGHPAGPAHQRCPLGAGPRQGRRARNHRGV